MEHFIVFNNTKRAKNYVKREQHKYNYLHDEGCGCCYSSSYMDIDGSLVVVEYSHTYHDNSYELSRLVIGRIKSH